MSCNGCLQLILKHKILSALGSIGFFLKKKINELFPVPNETSNKMLKKLPIKEMVCAIFYTWVKK